MQIGFRYRLYHREPGTYQNALRIEHDRKAWQCFGSLDANTCNCKETQSLRCPIDKKVWRGR